MDITGDPRTRALLGVSQGAGSLLRGAMDAGYVDQGFLRDSTTIARSTLAELQTQGLDQTTAAQAMADQLAALAQAYAATGAEMPEDLKAAMEAAGLTLLPTQLEVLKESRDYLKQIAGRMGGAEGYASGGIGNFGRETWVPLHGREAIVPLDRPSRVATGGTTINVHGTTKEANYTLERIIERVVRKAARHNPAMQRDLRLGTQGGR